MLFLTALRKSTYSIQREHLEAEPLYTKGNPVLFAAEFDVVGGLEGTDDAGMRS